MDYQGRCKKYFQNINRKVLFSIIERKISDPNVLWLTCTIIGSLDETGIPIGNYTSQYYANIYLNQLDQYVATIVSNFKHISKKEAKVVLEKIRSFLWKNLFLELNSKTQIFPGYQGVDFCGYKIWVNKMRICDASKRRIKRKLKALQTKYCY